MARDESPSESRRQITLSGAGKAYGIGFEFAAAVAGFCIVGWLVDRWQNSHPIGLVTGAVLGIIGATYNLIRQAIRMNRENQARKNKHENDRGD